MLKKQGEGGGQITYLTAYSLNAESETLAQLYNFRIFKPFEIAFVDKNKKRAHPPH
jgi:hypothetical protein